MKELTDKEIRDDEKFALSLRPALDTAVPEAISESIRSAAQKASNAKLRRRKYFRPRAFHFIATAAAALTISTYSVSQYRASRLEAIRAANIEYANCIIDLASLTMPDDTLNYGEEPENYSGMSGVGFSISDGLAVGGSISNNEEDSDLFYYDLLGVDYEVDDEMPTAETHTIESMATRLDKILSR